MQQPSPQEPIVTLLYQMKTMENDIAYLKSQLTQFEPARESDLKLQRITDTVARIETELSKVKDRLEGMNSHMVTQEKETQERDARQREATDQLQIKVLWGIVATILSIGSAVLIGYVTHLFK
jgi:chromosome segregation ATPase